MQALTDLKAILHSKRANIYYLEKCRVMQKDGRVLYLTEAKDENQYWNIPIANTTCLLLGTGTSITQAAMRMLASAGVLVGFSGGGLAILSHLILTVWDEKNIEATQGYPLKICSKRLGNRRKK